MKNNKIKNIEIDSFRAFTDKISLNFEVNDSVADIVVIYATNGTGKTSTIEGVEWAATGCISRLDTIFLNNRSHQRNPKEGYILKNRQSKKPIGSVSVEFDNGNKIHRQTKPKVNRNNDYCEGRTLATVKDMEYFSSNILSQGAISKFSYEASSGGLFNSLLDKIESKEDLEIYNALNATKTRIESSNSKANVEITLINDLISKENGEVDLIKNDYVENSNFQQSIHYQSFKNNFSFYEDLSLKSNDEIISYIRESETKLDNLKEKLSTFDINTYRVSAKNHLNSSKIIKLQKAIVLKGNGLSDLKVKKEEFESKKRSNSLFLGAEQLLEINNIISSYNNYLHKSEQYNKYLTKVNKTKHTVLMKYKSIDLLSFTDKENKLNILESLLLSLFSNADDSNLPLPEKPFLSDSITKDIQAKNDQLNLVTRSTFIKLNNEINDVINFKKKSSSLEGINIKIKALINEKEKIISFDEKLNLIKTYANEVINEKQLSNCPACGNQYENVDQLLESVSNFKSDGKELIDGSISTLTDQKNDIIVDIDNLTKAIDKQVSEERRLIQEDIQLLKERMDKFNELYSLLNEFDIKYERTSLKQVLGKVDLQKESLKKIISRSRRFKERYSAWSLKIRAKIDEIEGEFRQNKLDIKVIINSCFNQFDVGIAELIIISSSYHVLLFKEHQFNCSIKILNKDIELADSEIKSIKSKVLGLCSKAAFDFDANINEIREKAIQSKRAFKASYNYIKSNIKDYTTSRNEELYSLITSIQEAFSNYLSHIDTSQKLVTKNETITSHKSDLSIKEKSVEEGKVNLEKVQKALDTVNKYFTDLASESINNEVLNDMFMYIEPHLKYDEISFKIDLDGKNKGIYIQAKSSETQENNTPVYYLSEAQTNILSICIFLANHARESDTGIDTIIIDDPVQSMDDLNSYALIDLCKIFARRFNKQIIITTHNRSFYNLFKDKLPESRYPTKFITL